MTKYTFYDVVAEQWTTLPPPLKSDLSNKIVLVTGANTGIGFETVKSFANLRPKRLLLGCRSEAKGKHAVELIEKATGYRGIELAVFDHGNFNSVRTYVESFKDEPLDILVANAGMAIRKYEETEDGWESSLQVNHLSTALLSILLLPNLVRTAQQNGTHSRLVIVSSDTHFWTKFDEELLDSPNILRKLNDKEYCVTQGMAHRYADTKLLNILFTRALSEHLPAIIPVVPTVVNPGYCRSELRRNISSLSSIIQYAFMDLLVGRTAEQGARQLVWAALGPDGKEGKHTNWLRGAYVSTQGIKEPSDFAISKEGGESQDRIWASPLTIVVLSCELMSAWIYRKRRCKSCRRCHPKFAPASMNSL
ncbi:hypothetical protein NM688_g1968 [Phlebia brevispora]|uniref:Uncharacterized protein n=1 Tax=Phlebia brevispora TaxID=194682 RepID=A0ACC1TAB0_9APHY|nr:hypothetical protein NM688_g1968 [Phlebia brevispora]